MSRAPVFFKSPAAFRAWLTKKHDTETEVMVGFYRKDSGRKGITYHEALDEALCFGWIDGVRRTVDDQRYTNRFSPRKPRSNWSAVNIKRVHELIAAGRMAPPGLKAFESRDADRAAAYSYERKTAAFDRASRAAFQKNKKAWAFFEAQPPSYRRLAAWYVISAKLPATRARRLDSIISASAAGKRLGQFLSKKNAD
jgi:uncharacterized protein YdeI (YjbR/CyaY-like superfamily)